MQSTADPVQRTADGYNLLGATSVENLGHKRRKLGRAKRPRNHIYIYTYTRVYIYIYLCIYMCIYIYGFYMDDKWIVHGE